MSRSWPKRASWPYVAKNGRRSYRVGFYDHDKRERTRTFPSVRHARAWMHDYITVERRGPDSLRRFLLDLDAKEANEAEGRTIAEILELFLEVDAHPRNQEGVAPSTYTLYKSVLNCHLLGKPRRQPGNRRKLPPADYAVAIAKTQARCFNEPQAPHPHARHGIRESETGACHLSKSQAKTWGRECFTPAVQAVAQRPEFARILGATPYALRLRTEDPQTVASECGTSLKMLSDHYSFPIEDLREHEPRPADVEWRAARAAQANRRSHDRALHGAAENEDAGHRWESFLARLSARR